MSPETDNNCPRAGVLNLTACTETQFGQRFPIGITFPQFINVDPYYTEQIDGLHYTNMTDYSTFIELDQLTGKMVENVHRIEKKREILPKV